MMEEIQSLVYASKHPDAGKGRGKEGGTGCDVAKKLFSKRVPMQCYDQFSLFLSPRY